jgi:hypothetical protein
MSVSPGAARHTLGIYYGWLLVGTLGITDTISWGVLYYAFSVFLTPMEADLGWSRTATTGYRARRPGSPCAAQCSATSARRVSAACALVLMAAGVYQQTPLTSICLRACRSPFGFLIGN